MVYQLWPGAILDISILSGLSQYKLICFFATIHHLLMISVTAQKVKFSIKGFFSKCDQVRSCLRIWSHLLKKSWMENFIFWAVSVMTLIAKLLTRIDRETVYNYISTIFNNKITLLSCTYLLQYHTYWLFCHLQMYEWKCLWKLSWTWFCFICFHLGIMWLTLLWSLGCCYFYCENGPFFVIKTQTWTSKTYPKMLM